MATGYSFNYLVQHLYDIIYPVGICLDFNKAVDPNKLFPGTTWVQITDELTTRYSTNANVGKTGGADQITLGVNQLPRHAHGMAHQHNMNHGHSAGAIGNGEHAHHIDFWTDTQGEHTHGIQLDVRRGPDNHGVRDGESAGQWLDTTSASGAHSHHVVGDTWGGGYHTHDISVDNFIGNTGWTREATDNTGDGAGISVVNKYKFYVRWARTA